MFSDTFSIYIGIIIIIFIFCIFLLIFAPKSQNFFDKTIYNPQLDLLSQNTDLMLKTSICLNIKEDDDMVDDETYRKLEIYRHNFKYQELDWKKWPDSDVIIGDVFILPIFIFSKINQINSDRFSDLLRVIKEIPDIYSIYFLKLNTNSSFKKHLGIADLTNNSLRYIYCFNSYCYDDTECGVWVNAESKKTSKGSSYIYDSSKEHSLYNNTVDDVIYLVIDFKRPDSIPSGYSDYKLEPEILDLFTS